jgi:hypothetical protein
MPNDDPRELDELTGQRLREILDELDRHWTRDAAGFWRRRGTGPLGRDPFPGDPFADR